ncbi:MAG TPA: patatin [Flavobacteriia bacterium]|nr:patatin [Flavobacteriia bacterium]
MKNKLFFLFFFSFLLVFSQEKQDKKTYYKDLRVGLVLSGGGAKGFAHIGVLKVLDSLGVRIDYIGGTSAGAMIGSLYASGYNAKQIDSIINSYDFEELIQDKIPRNKYSLYQKQNSEKYAITLPIKNWKIGLPVALSKGQNILNEMTKLTKHVHHIKNFKKLPIPFYCVATDIENGDKVILENGFLPLAVKASGAFPTLLEPVDYNQRLLVDGGIVDNFPIDIMKEKGVDVIIGVDVQDKLKKRDALDSAPKMIMQIISFQMYDEDVNNKNNTDIYMHPKINGYSVISFDKTKELIDLGEKIALKDKDFLEAIAWQQQKKSVQENKKLKIDNQEYLKIDKVIIKGSKNYTSNFILSKLNIKEKDSITYNQFNTCIDGLMATENFKSVDYKFNFIKDNEVEILFNLKESEVSNSLQLSAHYDDLYKTGVLINFTSKHALKNNDIFSVDFVIGDNIRYNLDYLIDNGYHWQIGINSKYTAFKKNYIIDKNSTTTIFNTPQSIKFNDLTNQFYLLSKFAEKFALKIGAEHKYERVFTNNAINQKIFFDNRHYFSVFGNVILDTYDRKYFTKKGWYFNGSYHVYFARSPMQSDEETFSIIKGKLGFAQTFNKNITLKLGTEIGSVFGNAPATFNYSLGGNNQNLVNNYTSFYGYDFAGLQNKAYMKAETKIQYEFMQKHYISMIGNIAGLNTKIFSNGSAFDNLKTGYAIGYGYDSFIGPLELKYARSPDTNQDYWHVNIGFWF